MSETIKENTTIELRISKIEILNIEIISLETPNTLIQPSFTVNIKNFIDFESKLISTTVFTLIHGESQTEKYATLEIKITFEIKNINPVVHKIEEGQFEVNSSFLNMLNSISISTARGIVFSKLQGTYLSNFYMPLIDPTKFAPTNAIPEKEASQERATQNQ